MKIAFSLRYGVVGIYVDRNGSTVHVYPLPFIRVTLAPKEAA